jgi:hypothetical protein
MTEANVLTTEELAKIEKDIEERRISDENKKRKRNIFKLLFIGSFVIALFGQGVVRKVGLSSLMILYATLIYHTYPIAKEPCQRQMIGCHNDGEKLLLYFSFSALLFTSYKLIREFNK